MLLNSKLANIEKIVSAGVAILQPLMSSHGYVLVPGVSARGSGGSFTSGEFVKGNRRLQFHFRYSLGMVTYHLGPLSIDHVKYMALIGATGQYPGFSSDPLDGFRHWHHDLRDYCQLFLSGDDDALQSLLTSAARVESKRGLPA